MDIEFFDRWYPLALGAIGLNPKITDHWDALWYTLIRS
jgi:hypothetical protein